MRTPTPLPAAHLLVATLAALALACSGGGGGSGSSCTGSGDPCALVGDPCHTGAISCASGSPVCVASTTIADGSSCGTGQVCSAGACVACVVGAACTPTTNACHVGTMACGSGPSCVDTGVNANDGDACGTGGEYCLAAECVRDVVGTSVVRFAREAGTSPDGWGAWDGASALVPLAAGGYKTIAGTLGSSGAYSIPGVPVGAYLLALQFGGGVWASRTSASTTSGGWDIAGRDGITYGASSTPVTFNVTSPAAWTSGDYASVSSPNLALNQWPAGPAAGQTTGTAVVDFGGLPLPSAAENDVVYVARVKHGSQAGLAWGPDVVVEGKALAPFTVADGTPQSVAANLVALPLDKTLSVVWPVPSYALAAIGVAPGGAVDGHYLFVDPNPYPSHDARMRLADLVYAFAAPSGGEASINVSYGNPFPAAWPLVLTAVTDVVFTKMAPGATTPLTWYINVRSEWNVNALPMGKLEPVVSPVRSLKINGLDAMVNRTGVGTSPVLSWIAPLRGVPTDYQVYVNRLDNVGGVTERTFMGRFTTSLTSLELPPGVLTAGSTYYLVVAANVRNGDPFDAPGAEIGTPASWASVASGNFTP